MARITVEDCLENESNRFSLVMLASRRAKQLLQGKTPVTDTKGNKSIVSALREIASGKVTFIEREKIEADLAAAKLAAMTGNIGKSESDSAEVSIDSEAGGSA